MPWLILKAGWLFIGLALLLSAGQAQGQITGQVAAYGFEEGSGTTAADASGNGNTGAISGPAWNSAGRFGKALQFDGSNDLVTVADANSLDPANSITLMFWVYPTVAPSGWRCGMLKELPGDGAYMMYISNNTNIPEFILYISGGEKSLAGGSRLAANTWTHLAGTYDGANMRLYVNGTQVASRTQTGAITASSNPLRIGGNTVWGEYFQGRLDEVQLFNRALSASEIQSLMNTPVVSQGPAITINDISLNEGTGGTVNATFTASLSAVSTQEVRVNYTTAGNTAISSKDYIMQTGTLIFPPGTTSQPIPIPLVTDTLDEPDETFYVDLSAPVNATMAKSRGVCTIVDDDPPPSLSINDVTVTEGDTGTVDAVFTVTLSAASGQEVRVNYATANGTATAGSDYQAASNTLIIPAGNSSGGITVRVIGDTLYEGPNAETFLVNLTSPINATLGDSQGVGNIQENDPSPEALQVTPADGLVSTGTLGGPFNPTAKDYTIRNVGAATLNWSVREDASWLDLAQINNWTQATASAPWSARIGLRAVSFNGKLWLLGGALFSEVSNPYFNDAWSSPDGAAWTQEVASAPWSARYFHGAVVHNGKVWVMGGSNNGQYFNDVWSSPDGVRWSQATAAAPWSGRSHITVVSFNGKLWVMSGSDGSGYLSDSWSSSDGVTWTQATSTLPWGGRAGYGALVHANKLWIVGGYNDSGYFADVWNSSDGANWTSVTGNASWRPRGNHGAVSYDGKLWILGGYSVVLTLSDAWYSTDGAAWTQAANTPGWGTREQFGCAVHDSKIWLLGGNRSGGLNTNDVWYAPSMAQSGSLAPGASETVQALINSSAGTMPGGLHQGTVTFTNTDSGVNQTRDLSLTILPELSIDDASVVEGNEATMYAVFTARLSGPSNQEVSFTWATSSGTATSGQDFMPAEFTYSFPPGVTSVPIKVFVYGDTACEPDETFFVNLTAPVGAVIRDGQGQGTIISDDPELTVSPGSLDFSLPPGGRTSATLTLANAGSRTVDWLVNEIPGLGANSLNFSATLATSVTNPVKINWNAARHPDTLLVRFKPTAQIAARNAAHAAVGTMRLHAYRHLPLEVVRVPPGKDLQATVAAYAARPDVLYAVPNYISRLATIPNDQFFGQLWGLNNTGQDGGTSDADIDAPEVWSRCTGSVSPVVGIIDTGIDYNHPDLAPNMWTNPVEQNGLPGVDDDRNGIVDDIYGAKWDSGTGQPTSGDPMATAPHGTHVAGTIGAVGNNGIGVAGVNWSVRLMALNCYNTNFGGFFDADLIAGLDYAIDKGANLTSNSYGGGGFNPAIKDMIEAAGAAGQLFVAAAGNSSTDNDRIPHYPASYDSANIIAVAASDRNDRRASFSHWGRTSVDLAAPGADILSTLPGNDYGFYSGTSMATPHVSGAAALLFSIVPGADPLAVKNWILGGVDPLGDFMLDGPTPVLSGGRLNLANSVSLTLGTVNWLSEIPLAGSLAAGRSAEIRVTASAEGLEPDSTHTATLAFASKEAGSAANIPVTLTVLNLAQIGNTSAIEGNASTRDIIFTVTLVKPARRTLTVDWVTSGGTAMAPLDYQSATGRLTFPAGSSSQELRVKIVGDTRLEPDERFFVSLSNPSAGLAIGNGVGQGVIINDDTVPLQVYIDDNAPGDPGPGNPNVSDPLEDGSAAHPFDAIQEAVNAARDGCTLNIARGLYRENVSYDGKKLTLRSADPLNPVVVAGTVIDGGGAGPVITFRGDEGTSSALLGVKLTGGAGTVGGGVNGAGTLATIRYNLITGNTATQSGGGIYQCAGLIANNTITTNSVYNLNDRVSLYGGGLCDCDGNITSNTISGNRAEGSPYVDFTTFDQAGGGLAYCDGLIEGNTIAGNIAGPLNFPFRAKGGGLFACQGPIRNNRIENNRLSGYGGGLCWCHGTIENNIIAGNYGEWGGGAIYECGGLIRRNTISGNKTSEIGPGIAGCHGTIQGNVITGGYAYGGNGYGGGIHDCDGDVLGNLVALNEAYLGGSGITSCDGLIQGNAVLFNRGLENIGISNCAGTIIHCIVWGNGNPGDYQLSGSSAPTYSCVEGWTPSLGGWGNIAADPKFVNSAAGDYHLAAGSPCIDVGDNAALTWDAYDLDGDGDTQEPTPLDLDGLPRVSDGNGDGLDRVDIGPYEFSAIAPGTVWIPALAISPANTTAVVQVRIAGVSDMRSLNDLYITYDSTMLRLPDTRRIAAGPLFASWSVTSAIADGGYIQGAVRISMAGTTRVSTAGPATLLTLTFDVAGRPGQSTMLGLACGGLFNQAGAKIPAKLASGVATIIRLNGNLGISGRVSTWSGVPASEIEVRITPALVDAAQTSMTGGYRLGGLVAGLNYSVAPVAPEYGWPGVITAYDGALALGNTVGVDPLNAWQRLAADVTGEGTITAYDAALILQYTVGLVKPPFPVGAVCGFSPVDRKYQPLSADMSGQDFTMILYGDVDGNWRPGLGKPGAQAKPLGVPAGRLWISRVAAGPGGKVFVDVSGENLKDLLAITDLQLAYPSAVLALPDPGRISLSPSLQDSLTATRVDETAGVFHLSLARSSAVAGEGVLFTVAFDLKQTALPAASRLDLLGGRVEDRQGQAIPVALSGVELNLRTPVVNGWWLYGE